MTAEPQRVAQNSTLVRLAHTIVAQFRAWVAASVLTSAGAITTNEFATAFEESLLAEGVRTLTHWTRHSFLYRWLTKEPDPDVIVIDLRETYTVGPVIALLDRLAPTLERTWRGSRAYQLTEKLQTSPKRRWLESSRTLQLLNAALEPPEPPEEDRRD